MDNIIISKKQTLKSLKDVIYQLLDKELSNSNYKLSINKFLVIKKNLDDSNLYKLSIKTVMDISLPFEGVIIGNLNDLTSNIHKKYVLGEGISKDVISGTIDKYIKDVLLPNINEYVNNRKEYIEDDFNSSSILTISDGYNNLCNDRELYNLIESDFILGNFSECVFDDYINRYTLRDIADFDIIYGNIVKREVNDFSLIYYDNLGNKVKNRTIGRGKDGITFVLNTESLK